MVVNLVEKYVITGKGKIFIQILIFYSSNIVTLYDNHGNRKTNKRILETLGYEEFSKAILSDFQALPRHYVVINLSAEIPNDLRVCSNLFKEKYDNVLFY